MAVGIGDILRNIVKEKLRRDEVVASMTIRLVRGVEIARMAATAGFDMIYIDLEHSTLTLEATGQICQAALSVGVTPMVRVPANTPEYIQRVLDAGALGIIAPRVGPPRKRARWSKAAKFAPLGERGAGGALPHLQFRPFPTAEANAAINDATMVIVQFECAEAVRGRRDRRGRRRRHGAGRCQRSARRLGLAGQLEHPKVREAYARPSKPAASTASMSASAASRPGRNSPPNSSPWARAFSTGTDIQFLSAAMTEKAKQVRDIVV